MELPKRLIRFYSNTDYALECVALREITAVHVSLLNDPFDPNLDIALEFKDFNEFCSALKTKAVTILPEERSFNVVLQTYFERLSLNKNKLYLFCTFNPAASVHPDNLYMWSHYGNGHRGVAIEFNAQALEEFLQKENASPQSAKLFPVHYADEIPIITAQEFYEHIFKIKNGESTEDTEFSKKFVQIARSKDKRTYGQENEWRFMLQPKNKTAMKIMRVSNLPPNVINAVYLGYNISSSSTQDIILEMTTNFPHATVYKAEKQHGKFALTFTPCN